MSLTIAQVKEIVARVGLGEAIELIRSASIADRDLRELWENVEILYGQIRSIVEDQ